MTVITASSANAGTPYIYRNTIEQPIDWPSQHREADAVGSDCREYYLFQPSGATTPRPVVVYFHGYSTTAAPTDVRTQIQSYVNAGAIVIWPRLWGGDWSCLFTDPAANAAASIDAALGLLRNGDPTKLTRPAIDPKDGMPKMIYVGYSVGAIIALRAANLAGARKKHRPDMVLLQDPSRGGVVVDENGVPWDLNALVLWPLEKANLSSVASDTLVTIHVAARSEPEVGSIDVVTRVRNNLPAAVSKHAWVVPSACARWQTSSWVYDCVGLADEPDDVFVEGQHRGYIATHFETLDQVEGSAPRSVSNHARFAYFDHVAGCIRQLDTGASDAWCTGDYATYTGTFWDGVVYRDAPRKYVHPLFAP